MSAFSTARDPVDDVLERVARRLPHLSPKLRLVGRRVLDDPASIARLSVSELAAELGVAQPTISRFVRALGYNSFPVFRLELTSRSARADRLPEQRAAITGGPGDPGSQAGLERVGAVLRRLSSVEIWTDPEFADTGEVLAAGLQSLGIRAAACDKPGLWEARLRGLPARSAVMLLAAAGQSPARDYGAPLVRPASAMLLGLCEGQAWPEAEEKVVRVPASGSPYLAMTEAAELIVTAVRSRSEPCGPTGSADAWLPWPHCFEILLAAPEGPVPATFLASAADPTRRRPLVMFSEGFRGARSDGLPPGRPENRMSPAFTAALLNAGYSVLLVENPAHGERRSHPWDDPVLLTRESFQGARPDILDLAQNETPYLVDDAVRQGLVSSAGRIAALGHSWGGLQAVLRFLGDPRIACAAAVIPVIDPACLTSLADLRALPGLRRFSLADRTIAGRGDRPLLLISGGADTIAPEKYVRAFIDDLGRAPEGSGAVSWSSLPDVGHELDARQVDLALSWLQEHLPSGKR